MSKSKENKYNFLRLRKRLENNSENEVSPKHCLSTGNPGEFARGLRIECIIFLISEREQKLSTILCVL